MRFGREMIPFIHSGLFRRDYNEAFRKIPLGANVLQLLTELANECGEVRLVEIPETVITLLLARRFDYFRAYQLSRGPKR
jgi:hypothetical protein